jgi:hypothetical protein
MIEKSVFIIKSKDNIVFAPQLTQLQQATCSFAHLNAVFAVFAVFAVYAGV